jgi:hypothetical protein
MGLFGGGGGNIARRAGEEAAKSIQFTPEDIAVEGLGGVSFEGNKKNGLTGISFDPSAVQQEQIGAFGANVMPAVQGAGALTGGVTGAGQQGLTQAQAALAALGEFDPLAAAEERFTRLDNLLAERRMTDRSALESRLLQQGRLDSTAGARQLAEYEAGIERERAQMLDRQFGEAQAAQTALAQRAGMLTGIGTGAGQYLTGQAISNLQGGQAVIDPMFRMAQLSGDLEGMSLQAQQARAGAISGHNQIAGASGGGSMLGGLMTGALTAAGTAFGGPMGAMAGQALGGMLTSGGGSDFNTVGAAGNWFGPGPAQR